MSRLAALLFCLCASLLSLTACDRQDPPMLLDVTGLSPRSVEAGDGVEISGDGFPEGKSATVTFDGTLYRAGLSSVDNFQMTFPARVDSCDQLSFTLGPELEEVLSQGEHSSVHGTFRGRALVAFAPKVAGAPPVLGQLKDLTVEIYSSKASAALSPGAVGSVQKLLSVIGLSVEQTSQQLQVIALQSGRAERAGLLPGDTLLSANGVSIFSEADLLPAEQERQLLLLVKRNGVIAPWVVQLSVDGFSPALPLSFSWVFAIAIAAMLWLAAFSWKAPMGQPALAFTALNVNRNAAAAPWFAVLVGVLVFVTGLRPQAFQLQALWVVGGLAGVALLRPLLGFWGMGFQGNAGFRLRHATASALKIQLIELVALFALVPVVLKSGGLSLTELKAVQGVAPWHWSALASVMGMAGALLFLLTTLFDASGLLMGGAVQSSLRPHPALRGAARGDALLVALKCALFVPLFLGGGVPAPGLVLAGRAAAVLAASVELGKYALVALLVFRLRSRLDHPRVEDLARPLGLGLTVTALFVGLSLAPVPWQRVALFGWIDQGVAPALCLVAASGVLFALLGRRWKQEESPRGMTVNPWL